MFIKFDEIELLDFFESKPTTIGDYAAGEWLYSYHQNGFKVILLIDIYEMSVTISITYYDNVVYHEKRNGVIAIVGISSSLLKVILDKEKVIIINKDPLISVTVEHT